MLVGQPPFVDDDPLKVYQQVSRSIIKPVTLLSVSLLSDILYLCVYGTVCEDCVRQCSGSAQVQRVALDTTVWHAVRTLLCVASLHKRKQSAAALQQQHLLHARCLQ
jgi:hypothetical protein